MYKKMQVCAVVWYLDFKIEKRRRFLDVWCLSRGLMSRVKMRLGREGWCSRL